MKKNNKKIVPNNSFTEFLLYTTPNGKVKVEIFLRDENIWLTQNKIALLFGVQRPAITKHLRNIFESGELVESRVSSILEHTTQQYIIKGFTMDDERLKDPNNTMLEKLATRWRKHWRLENTKNLG